MVCFHMILDPCCNWVAHGSRQGVVLRLCDESKSEALVLAGGSVLPISVENNAMYPHHHPTSSIQNFGAIAAGLLVEWKA